MSITRTAPLRETTTTAPETMSMPDRKRVTERLIESHYLKSPLHGVGKPRPPLATISAMFARAVDDAPEAVAFRHRDVSLTYSEAGRAVAALARRLASLVQPGAVAALVLPNSIEFGIVLRRARGPYNARLAQPILSDAAT